MKSETVLLLAVVVVNLYGVFADEKCGMDLDYVHELEWDKSSCKSANINSSDHPCCNALHIVFGVGLAQYLRNTSMFELPTHASADACLKLFQQQLDSLRLSPLNLVAICLGNTSDFVSSPLLCDGIQTKQEWIHRVMSISADMTSDVDSACKDDLSDQHRCQVCNDKLTNMYLASTKKRKCMYFGLLYAAGVVNKFGPKNKSTSHCILRLPIVDTAPTASRHRPVLAYALLGVVPALLICALGLLYSLWVRKRNRKAAHRGFVRRNEEIREGI